jgi:hypothetical protein
VAESLIVAGFLALVFGAVVTADALRRKGDEKDPEQPTFVERDRAKSEANMAAPVTEADEADAAPLVAYVVEIGTDELPLVHPPVRRHRVDKPPSRQQLAVMRNRALAPARAFDADPLGAPIPGRHRLASPVDFGEQAERWFTPAVEAPPRTFPDLPAEPAEWALGGFTAEWTKADVERMVAEAKAGADR